MLTRSLLQFGADLDVVRRVGSGKRVELLRTFPQSITRTVPGCGKSVVTGRQSSTGGHDLPEQRRARRFFIVAGNDVPNIAARLFLPEHLFTPGIWRPATLHFLRAR